MSFATKAYHFRSNLAILTSVAACHFRLELAIFALVARQFRFNIVNLQVYIFLPVPKGIVFFFLPDKVHILHIFGQSRMNE